MNKFLTNIMNLSFMFSIPIVNILYGIINHPSNKVHNLVTDIDRATPFIKYFIVPYGIWYGFVFAVLCYLCMEDRQTYYKTLISVNIGLLACYAVYVLFQTTVPRPQLTGDDIFTKMIEFLYNIDKPYNCFPSIHCLTSYIMIKAISGSKTKHIPVKIAVISIAITIILSTLFIKQHVVLDALSAMFLGGSIFDLVNGFPWRDSALWGKNKKFINKKVGNSWTL